MSEHKRDKTELHKKIPSIFKGTPNSQTDEGQRPSGTPAPERTAYTKSKSPAPEQKHQVSKVDKAPQALPKAVPVKSPKAVPAKHQKVVPAKRHETMPAKQHKAMPTKQQKAANIRHLKTAGVVWATCFVILLLAYVLILRPQKSSRNLIESRLSEKKQIYESALRAAQKETRIQLNEQIERLQNRLKDFVADFGDSANLTFEISQIANERKVASFSIKGKDNLVLSGEPGSMYISENHIVISFIGRFNQFATFLNALERHRPVLLVDKFTIAHSGQDDSVFRVNLNVAAFVRKQQKDKTTNKQLDQVYGMKI